MSSSSQGINRLKTHFGGTLDEDVLNSVLMMFNDDVTQAIQFLEIQNNDTTQTYYYNNYINNTSSSNQENLPMGYQNKPFGWKNPTNEDIQVLKNKNQYKSSVELIDSITGKKYQSGLTTRQIQVIQQVKSMFLEDRPVAEHFKVALDVNTKHEYLCTFLIMLHQNIELTGNTKYKILSVLWATKNGKIADYLLSRYGKQFHLPEVLKALKLLDTPRRVRQMKNKIEKYKDKASSKTINKWKNQMTEISNEMVPSEVMNTSVSGALVRRIKKWVNSIEKEKLAFYALLFPKDGWKQLADICHFSPKDFKLDCFLDIMFEKNAPDGSIFSDCKNIGILTNEQLIQLVKKHKIPYSFLRTSVPYVPFEARAEVAKYEPIEQVLWYYEELTMQYENDYNLAIVAQINQTISQRLSNGEVPKFSYGKLVERLFYYKNNNVPFWDKLMNVAEEELKKISLPLEPLVVVLSDVSYSMDVSLRTSSIISSVVANLCDADLKFFNVKCFDPAFIPKNVQDVIELTNVTKCDGLTAPACAIQEYYDKKTPVEFFIVVTDEIENEKHNNTFFAQMFYKYYTEIFPSQMIFVSFLDDPGLNTKGRMVKSLESLGINPVCYVLDGKRPDLSKLGSILGKMFLESNLYPQQVKYLVDFGQKTNVFEDLVKLLDSLPKPKMLNKEEVQKKLKDNIEKEEKKIEDMIEKDLIPNAFICPITQELMKEPVLCTDGHTYERVAIEDWMKRKMTSPMTNEPLLSSQYFPNFTVKSQIQEWISKNVYKTNQ